MKKIFYGITLVIGIGICLALLFFPILEFDRDAIYKHHKDEIEEAIALDTSESKTYEEKKDAAINEIIYNTCIVLQMYKRQTDVVFDENGNAIDAGSDTESMMFDIYALKEDGIKYTDLINSVKNQINWDIALYKSLKVQGKVDSKVFFDNWSNPLLMILILIFVACEFVCGVILIIKSYRGIEDKKRNETIVVSICGIVVTTIILCLGLIFRTKEPVENLNSINDFVKLLSMNLKGTTILILSLIGFGVSVGLGIAHKSLKKE